MLCGLDLTNPRSFNLIAGSSEFRPIYVVAIYLSGFPSLLAFVVICFKKL